MELQKGVPFEYTEGVVELVFDRCNDSDSGGRVVDAILTNTLLPEMGRQVLEAVFEGRELSAIKVDTKNGEFEYIIS